MFPTTPPAPPLGSFSLYAAAGFGGFLVAQPKANPGHIPGFRLVMSHYHGSQVDSGFECM